MEPRIRYAKTVDGGAVAYWSHGSGPNLLHLPWLPWGHAELECRDPELSLWYEGLASVCTLIRYDGRGTGLSDRVAPSYGIETQLADIDAVVAQPGFEQFAILASLNMGPAALHYVARHPERVTHLILWCTYARTEDYSNSPAVRAIRSLLESDWVLYTETGAHAFVGWNAGEAAHGIARMMREGTTPEVAKQFYADTRYVDCSSLLPEIRVPTLVIHPRQFPLIDVSIARALASSIPNSRFGIFEGDSVSPTRGELKGVLASIADFLGEEVPLQPAPEKRPETNHQPNNRDGLSARELEVLKLIAGGKSNREIADVLVLSPRTVERHVANIYTKVNVNNRAQAATYAISNYLA